MQFNIVNDNTATAYFAFGSVPVTGSIVVGAGETVLVNGTAQAEGAVVQLSQDVVLEIPSGESITGLDVEDFEGGKFLVSLGGTLSSTDNTNFNYGFGVDSTVRWDKIEASISSDSTSFLDLSAQDFLGINLRVEDITTPSNVLQTSSVAFDTAFNDIVQATLGSISNDGTYDPNALVPVYGTPSSTAGIPIDNTGTDALRLISPATIDEADYAAYSAVVNTFTNYIASAETHMGTIYVTGLYNGVTSPPSNTYNQFNEQDYNFKTSFDASGDLLLVSQDAVTGGIAANTTIEIAAADVLNEIIGLNTNYDVIQNGNTILTEGPGANDVFSKAVVDLAAGFNFGFVDGDGVNPGVTSGSGGTLTFAQASQDSSIGTEAWYNVQKVSLGDAFANANSDGYYNVYAAELYKFGNAYGFGVEDEFPEVQLDPTNPSDTLQITIASDTAPPPCFARGTGIATAEGYRAVEDLKIGDLVITARGDLQKIRWIGMRRVDCARHQAPAAVRPVRITAGAFGPAQPKRDLDLSPDHAVFADGVLVPVKHLINGSTIRQLTVDDVTYYHVELAAHDILFADGLAVESYLDTGDRGAFANGGAVVDLHGTWGSSARDIALIMETLGCAPFHVTGPEVTAIRNALSLRAQELRAVA